MPHTGPKPWHCAYVLETLDEGKMCGRGDFLVHGCQGCTGGDESVPPAPGCSAGCVVINRENRIKLRIGDLLNVVSYEPTNLFYL